MANANDWPSREQSCDVTLAHIGETLTADSVPNGSVSRAIPREVAGAAEVSDAEHAYAFGLWCADGYWWSSSIGLSNVDPQLVLRFAGFLSRSWPRERLCLRIYQVTGRDPDPRVLQLTSRISIRPACKMKQTAYHLYVNSRHLVRQFFSIRESLLQLPTEYVGAYLAGRFDGDGSFGTTPRIAYASREEAQQDTRMLSRVGIEETSVLEYKKANEFCIYIHKSAWQRFRDLIDPHSWKICHQFTL